MTLLADLGYIRPPSGFVELLSDNLHGLNYKTYTFKGTEKFGRTPLYMVGIYSDYYIHYVNDISHSSGMYDLYTHDIPQSIPVKVEDLINTVFFDNNTGYKENPNVITELLKSFQDLGWLTSMNLMELKESKYVYSNYYFNVKEKTYEIGVFVSEDSYLIKSVGIVEKKYYKDDFDFSNTLPSIQDLILIEISKLDERKNQLLSQLS
jgi:hypothetical protein